MISLIGGIWLIYWLEFNVSVAVAVGFIALAGVAAEIGVLVLTFIDQEVEKTRQLKLARHFDEESAAEIEKTTEFTDHNAQLRRQSKPQIDLGKLTKEEIMKAVHFGTSERVRPIAMTATAIIAGLVPIMWSSGTGSEVMQRIAAPMVGGMVSVTILSLLVLPVIYGLVIQAKEHKFK